MNNVVATTEDTVLEQVMSNRPNHPDFILKEWMRTEFNLPQSVRMEAEIAFMRVWEGNFVMSAIQEGKLHYNGHAWIVHFQSVPTVVADAAEVACSFRKHGTEYYVVIKVWVKGAKA